MTRNPWWTSLNVESFSHAYRGMVKVVCMRGGLIATPWLDSVSFCKAAGEKSRACRGGIATLDESTLRMNLYRASCPPNPKSGHPQMGVFCGDLFLFRELNEKTQNTSRSQFGGSPTNMSQTREPRQIGGFLLVFLQANPYFTLSPISGMVPSSLGVKRY